MLLPSTLDARYNAQVDDEMRAWARTSKSVRTQNEMGRVRYLFGSVSLAVCNTRLCMGRVEIFVSLERRVLAAMHAARLTVLRLCFDQLDGDGYATRRDMPSTPNNSLAWALSTLNGFSIWLRLFLHLDR